MTADEPSTLPPLAQGASHYLMQHGYAAPRRVSGLPYQFRIDGSALSLTFGRGHGWVVCVGFVDASSQWPTGYWYRFLRKSNDGGDLSFGEALDWILNNLDRLEAIALEPKRRSKFVAHVKKEEAEFAARYNLPAQRP